MKINWSDLHRLTEKGISKIKDNISGVYRLSYKDSKSGNIYVFYVGQAGDLKKRLLEHIGLNEENECIKNKLKNSICYFKCAIVTNQNERDGIESFLYKKYKPSCNKQEPQAKPIEVNLENSK